MAVIPFATGTHTATSLAVDTEYLENLYPEVGAEDSYHRKTAVALHLRPGLTELYNYGPNPIRGLYVAGDSVSRFTIYAVHGSGLFSQTADADPVFLGALDSTEGPVYMSGNGRQIMMTDGANGYIWDIIGNSFVKLDEPTHGWVVKQPRFIAYLSTYFAVMDAADGRYYISDNYNGLQWNAADFGVAETDPDGMVAMVAEGGELWLFGTRTTEIHYGTGASDFPFAPKLSATLEWGVAAPFSVLRLSGQIVFLAQTSGGNLRVFLMNGYQPVPISDDALETRLSELTRVDDATAVAFRLEGQDFYILTFPTDEVSWAYNGKSGQWFRVCSCAQQRARYVGQWSAGRENETLVTDFRDGRLYTVSTSEADGSDPIYVRARGFIINEQEAEIPHRSVQVVCEMGTGPIATDPQIMLRWSNDSGYTWSNPYWRSLGPLGEYRRRARWWRLGRARNRVYELEITDPVPKRVVGIVVNGSD